MQRNADQASVRIVLTVDVEAEPIRGSVDDGSGASIEFTGWLELMSAIAKLRAAASCYGQPGSAAGSTDPT